MSHIKQQTIASQFTLEGVGIHSGETSRLTVKPASKGGIRFKRMDIDGNPEFPAHLDFVQETDRGTNLGVGELRIMTIEHIMSSLIASEVDHVVIELSGNEIPILDGSFQPFCRAITAVGLRQLSSDVEVMHITRDLRIECDSGASYRVSPCSNLQISAQIEFTHSAIGRQSGVFKINPNTFGSEIAAARTFGFESDVGYLKARGLARGASLENAIVLDDTGVINGPLRFKDEFLRHKVGDLLGDLALIGKRIRASIICEKPGHEGNIKMARFLRDKVKSND